MRGPTTNARPDAALPAPKGRAAAPIAALVLLVLACVGRLRPDAPIQGWYAELGPVVPHDTFPADCSLCHVTGDWRTLRADFVFDHGTETGHPLTGAHAGAQCLRCHNDRGPVSRFAVKGCAGCHGDPHEGRLGRNCRGCHDEETWQPREQIARHASTRFPLVGAHAATACFRCHEGALVGNFQRADVRCESCHRGDLARAQSPDHAASGWTTDCQRCHVPTAWLDARFAHTAFPLTGMHAGAACESCHAGGRFRGTPGNCVDCHLAVYDAARNPDHRASGFPTTCETCHGTAGWEGAAFDHRFPIRSGDPRAWSARAATRPRETSARSRASTATSTGGRRWTTSIAGCRRTCASPACLTCHPQGRE